MTHHVPGAVAFPPPPPPPPPAPAAVSKSGVRIGFGAVARPVPARAPLIGGRTAAPSEYHPYLAQLQIGGVPLEFEFEITADVAERVRKFANRLTSHIKSFVSEHSDREFAIRTEKNAEGVAHKLSVWRVPADSAARAARSAARIAALGTPEAKARRAARKAAKALANAGGAV